MDVVFNELSVAHNGGDVDAITESFILLEKTIVGLSRLIEQQGNGAEKVKLTVNEQFYVSPLLDNYTFNNWMNEPSVSQTLKSWLL